MRRLHGFALALVTACTGRAPPPPSAQPMPFARPSSPAATDFDLRVVGAVDSAELSGAMAGLARAVLVRHEGADNESDLFDRLHLQLVAGNYAEAAATLERLRRQVKTPDPGYAPVHYASFELFSRAKLRQATTHKPFEDAVRTTFKEVYARLDDEAALHASWYLVYDLGEARARLEEGLARQASRTRIGLGDAVDLVKRFGTYDVYRQIQPLLESLIAEDNGRRYLIDDDVRIKTRDGATISAVVVRQRSAAAPRSAVLFFTIYTDKGMPDALRAAAHGYVGVLGFARGKRASTDEILPYEHEVNDVFDTIDWVSKQPWCDGKVGMYGGSYGGFAQWAATKHLHPALKTIVPYVAVIPGLGLPMENNVFLNANYGWAFYVTDNRLLDDKVYFDRKRWFDLNERWFASGRPYREIDRVDGAPNRLLQRWLRHPSYDAYWQAMVPYGTDFAKIDIPVLSVTGYYDDAQISALHYLVEHYRYNPSANHYLVIGPYSHFGAQRRTPAEIQGYTIDPVARIDTTYLTYEWLDHVLRGGEMPPLLADKINYEVMGANEWRHAPSLAAMSNETLTLYLTDATSGANHRLDPNKPVSPASVSQTVDFADRKTTNNAFYPDPIVRDAPELDHGIPFISEPFTEPVEVSGRFSGELHARTSKKDMDVGLELYEVTPDGKYFCLSSFIGRASYARDMSVRRLLVPGRVESIPFERTRMVSRQLSKGSRLLVVLNVNKQPFAQVNYGTGKDVSDESIADAKTPLAVDWYSDSYVKIPVRRAATKPE